MIYGIGILSVAAVLFFLGILRNISIYFKNDIVALIIILLTIAGNVLPPLSVSRSKIYFGGCFLYIMLTVLIFISKRDKELLLSLISVLFGSVLLIAFRVFLIDTIVMSEILRITVLIIMGAIVAFVIGRDPLSIFATAYIGYFISEILAFIVIENHTMLLGGGLMFTIMIASSALGIILFALTARLPKESRVKNTFSFKGEASNEFNIDKTNRSKKQN